MRPGDYKKFYKSYNDFSEKFKMTDKARDIIKNFMDYDITVLERFSSVW